MVRTHRRLMVDAVEEPEEESDPQANTLVADSYLAWLNTFAKSRRTNPTNEWGTACWYGSKACLMGQWLMDQYGWTPEDVKLLEGQSPRDVLTRLFPDMDKKLKKLMVHIEMHADEGHTWKDVVTWAQYQAIDAGLTGVRTVDLRP